MAVTRRGAGFALLTLLTLFALPPLQGVAGAQVGCGAVITRSTTLRSDVGPCSGDGLVVVSDKVRLNLGGHRVFGTAAQGTSAGIRLADVRRVTVLNGSVDNFDAGLLVYRGGSNTIRDMRLHDNNSNQFVADNPDLGELGDGILILGSPDNRITNNDVRDNGPFSGISIVSETENQSVVGPLPTGNVISRNVIAHNAVPDVCTSEGTYFGGPCNPGEAVFNQDIGLRIEGPGASFTTVSRNLITGSGREGLAVLNTFNRFTPPDAFSPQNTDSVIVDNDITANGTSEVITDPEVGQLGGDGIFVRCFVNSPPQGCGTRTLIENNRVTNNPAHGIALGKARGNTVRNNRVVGNGFGSMTSYASDPPYTDGFDLNVDPPCDNNTWVGNILGTVNQPCVRHHVGTPAAPATASPPSAAIASSPRAASAPAQSLRSSRRATL
jgi:parallel beta-helix repeat protein